MDGSQATYRVNAYDESGALLAHDEFSPIWNRRPYIGPFPNAGQVQVAQHDVGHEFADQRQRVLAAVGLADDFDVGLARQNHAHPCAHQCVVIDHENADGHPCHLSCGNPPPRA